MLFTKSTVCLGHSCFSARDLNFAFSCENKQIKINMICWGHCCILCKVKVYRLLFKFGIVCVCALYNNEMKARYCHQTHQSWAIKLTAFCRTSLGNELAKDFCFQNEIVCAIVYIFLDESFLFVYAIILTLLYYRFYFFISFFSISLSFYIQIEFSK